MLVSRGESWRFGLISINVEDLDSMHYMLTRLEVMLELRFRCIACSINYARFTSILLLSFLLQLACNVLALSLGSHELNQVDDSLGVSPFVIIPRNQLDKVVVQSNSCLGIKHGRTSLSNEIL